MSEEMWEMLSGVLGRLERIAEALETMQESQQAIRLNSDENLRHTAEHVANVKELTAVQIEAAKRNAEAMERAEAAHRRVMESLNPGSTLETMETLGMNSGPDSGAAPGGDSGPGPGDEPIRVVLTPEGEPAPAGFGWCGSCGCASSTDAQSC
ncbi:hypothetical protein EBQ81_00250, partial [bacterium]|nr:hypothetical protein [bacterium]